MFEALRAHCGSSSTVGVVTVGICTSTKSDQQKCGKSRGSHDFVCMLGGETGGLQRHMLRVTWFCLVVGQGETRVSSSP